MQRIASILSLLWVLVGCLPQVVSAPGLTPTAMIHHSSMGDLESAWAIAEVPRPFQGNWRLASTAALPLPPDYSALVFGLAPLPGDCRVYLAEAGELREVGTMPYAGVENGEFYATFAGDFHLTYTLWLRQAAGGAVVGRFEHAGSGVIYFEGEITLEQVP